jgi:ACT domain-containing protein
VPTDLEVVLTDEPGQLAKLGQAMGTAGVNIHG